MFRKILDLLSDAATYGASSVVSQLVNFLLLPLFTHYLTPADYGVMAMLTVANTFFTPIAHLGLPNAIFRHFNKEKDPERRNVVLGTGLVSVAVTSAALLVLALSALDHLTLWLLGDPNGRDLLAITLVTSAVGATALVPFSVLRASRRVKTAAVLNVAKLVVTLSTTVILVVPLQLGVMGVVIGTLAGEALTLVVNLVLTVRSFDLRPDRTVLGAMIKYGLPFVPTKLQGYALVYLGQYALAKMVSLDEAGIYSVALKFAAPLVFVVNAVQQAWVPYKFQVLEDDAKPAEFFRSITTYYVAAMSFGWVGVALWGPELVRSMTAPEFHGAAALVAPVASISLAQGIRYMMGTGMEASDDTRPLPFVSFAGLVVVTLLTFVLVPRFGGLGVAAATTVSWLVMGALILPFSRRRFRVDYDWSSIAALSSAAIALVVAGSAIQSSALVFRLGIGALATIAYPGFTFLILLRSTTERERMQHIWARIRPRPSASSERASG
jgi:O-antigen/teichoic acid export membrane protein